MQEFYQVFTTSFFSASQLYLAAGKAGHLEASPSRESMAEDH